MTDLQQTLLSAFKEEQQEHLEAAHALLAKLKRKNAEHRQDDLNELFRRMHSLKGAARVVGFRPVEEAAHRIEALFETVREGDTVLDETVLLTVESGIYYLEDCAACLLEGRSAPDPDDFIKGIEQLPTDAGHGPVTVAQTGSDDPAVDIEKGQGHNDDPDIGGEGRSGSAVDSVRLSAHTLDELLLSSGELMNEVLRQDGINQDLRELRDKLDALRTAGDPLTAGGNSALRRIRGLPELGPVVRYVEKTINITRKLDRALTGVHSDLGDSARGLRRIANEIREEVQIACMVPVESVFAGFRKMVRDLAQAEGKSVELVISGFDVIADRRVLQALKDPVMHLLRNAVSHGIEPEAERVRRKKPKRGEILLDFITTGSNLEVRIADDGSGIDKAVITELASKQGLLNTDQVLPEDPEILLQLLFLPGFTTTKQATELSGRGMGLSVVQETVKNLQGEVRVTTGSEFGLRFTITCPINLSLQQLMLVCCSERNYALPVHAIERMLRVNKQQIASLEGRPILRLDDASDLPLVSLSDLLGYKDTGIRSPGNFCHIVVLRLGIQRLGLVVDELSGEIDGLVRPLGAYAGAGQTLFAGGLTIGVGNVVLALNPAGLMNRYTQADKDRKLNFIQAPEAPASPVILLVDDSFTTRTLEQSLLEAHGYKVRIAVDGIDALDTLKLEPVNMVITDIEMPRMDGFGLLAAMKAEAALKAIPTIIVSSFEDETSKQRGLNLGADAYIVKHEFDQVELIKTIEQLL